MSSNDVMTGSAFGDTLNMSSGNDSAFGGSGNDTLNGQNGNDTLNGEADNDTLNGGSGTDTLNGGTGNDTMNGGDQNDTYFVDTTLDVAAESFNDALAGVDTVLATATHTLGFGIENLTQQGGANINGTGNGNGNTILGSSGNNVLSGLGGIDTIRGNNGDDTLLGGDQNDTLEGGIGNDTLDGGTGGDSMTGGVGNDTYVVDNALDTTVEGAIVGGIDLVQSSTSHTLAVNVENLILTGTAITTGNGNNLDNAITGNNASNVLNGGFAGNDNLSGGGGADTLIGGTGADNMNGGNQNDTYFVDNVLDVAAESFNNFFSGIDTVFSTVSHTLGFGVETLTLQSLANLNGTGNGNGNVINGNVGINTLAGLGGNDTLNGGGGADTLNGGAGADTLNGGAAGDVFDFNSATDSGPAARDLIQGFDAPGAGAGDLIDLGSIDAIAGGAINEAFTFLGVIQNPFPPATEAGSLWLRDEGGNTVVFGNVNSSDDPEIAIIIADGGVAPSAYDATDFIL